MSEAGHFQRHKSQRAADFGGGSQPVESFDTFLFHNCVACFLIIFVKFFALAIGKFVCLSIVDQ